jgi:hypothetical protein
MRRNVRKGGGKAAGHPWPPPGGDIDTLVILPEIAFVSQPDRRDSNLLNTSEECL